MKSCVFKRLAAAMGLAVIADLSVAVTYLDYVEFPKGAAVKTGIIPGAGTEVEVTFEYLSKTANAAIFGTSRGTSYFNFYLWNAVQWGFGINNTLVANKGFVFSYGIHTVVFNDHETGQIVIDGEPCWDVSAAQSTKELLIGNVTSNLSDAKFNGRIYSFKVRNDAGELIMNLKPCIRETDGGEDEVCFYDVVTGNYFVNAADNCEFRAGNDLSRVLEITGAPFEASAVQSEIEYGKRYNLTVGEELSLSVPASLDMSNLVRAECTGYRLYRYDPVTEAYTLMSQGDGNTLSYRHDGYQTRLEWQWNLTTLTEAAVLYVSPSGNDSNNGSSWAEAFATPQAAIDAAAEGSTILVAPGHYIGTSTDTSIDGQARSILINKDVHVVGIAGPGRTIMDSTYNRPRSGLLMTTAGASLTGFTFTNGCHNAKAKKMGIELRGGAITNCLLHVRGNWASVPLYLTGVAPVTVSDLKFLYCECYETYAEGDRLVVAEGGTEQIIIDGLVITGQNLHASSLDNMIYLAGNTASKPVILRNALIADNEMGLNIQTSGRGNIINMSKNARLVNCTVVNNKIRAELGAVSVGGSSTIITNCIITGNVGANGVYGDIHKNSNLKYIYSTLCNQLTLGEKGNLNGNPCFEDEENGNYRLAATSKCVDAGAGLVGDTNLVSTIDIEGNPRINGNGIDLGCYENLNSGEMAVSFESTVSKSEPGVPLTTTFIGSASGAGDDFVVLWNFGDGTTSTEWPGVEHTYSASGSYTVTLTITSGGESVTYTIKNAATVVPPVCYVSTNGSDEYPYDTPTKAARKIQDALDVGAPKVVVDDGTYQLPYPCLGIDRPVTLISKNGPEVTILDSPISEKSLNHYHLNLQNDNACVSGFTFTGGYADYRINPAYGITSVNMAGGIISNCVWRNNGRVSRSTFIKAYGNALITDCEMDGHGVEQDNDTSFQGALYLSENAVADRCRIHSYNMSGAYENGTNLRGPVMIKGSNAELRNSLVYACTNNTVQDEKYGGIVQVYEGSIVNCTIVDNYLGGRGAVKFFSKDTSTATQGKMKNTIIYNNTALSDVGSGAYNDIYAVTEGAEIKNCCAGSFDGIPGGVDASSTILNPEFSKEEGSEYHLTSFSSSCLGKATPLSWMTDSVDLAGNPRIDIKKGAPDIGCYEFVYSDEAEPLSGVLNIFGDGGRVPATVSFVPTIVGGESDEYSYLWNFGDGNTSSEAQPVNVYAKSGVFNIKLLVTCGSETINIEDQVLVVPQICYVSTNGTHKRPYDSWETAATNVLDVVSLNPEEIIIDDGTYYVSGVGINIGTDIKMHSRNGSDKTTIRGTYRYINNKYDSGRLFLLNHPNAIIKGITFAYGHSDIQGADVVGKVEAGTLDSIVVTNVTASYRSSVLTVTGANSVIKDSVIDLYPISTGGNADCTYFMSVVLDNGALMDGCVVKNADYTTQGGSTAHNHAAVQVLNGAILRNTLVRDCKITQSAVIDGSKGVRSGAVILHGSATVENCTIVNNDIYHDAALTIIPADISKPHTDYQPVVRNNIVWGNRSTGNYVNDICDISKPKQAENCYLDEPRVTYSCASELTSGEGNIAADPCFRGNRIGRAPYSLRNTSPCVGKGIVLDWMTDGVDLNGKPRLIGTKPDLGAYELQTGTPTMMILK